MTTPVSEPERTSSVAVVVPCRNEVHTIGRVLDACSSQTRGPDEVVIVDDGSTDGTDGAIARWRDTHPSAAVRVLRNAGRGVSAAMNTGIRAVDADVIVRLDGHCLPDAHYIEASMRSLSEPNTGVAGGIWQIAPGADTLVARGIASVLSHPLGSGGADYRTPSQSHVRVVDTVPFGAFRKSLWSAIGGFDERLIRNQDYDFNYRVRLAGFDVVLNPAIVSVYKARPTFGALWRQYFDYGYWKVIMLRKFPASIRPRQVLPLLLVPMLAAAAAAAALFRTPVPLLIPAFYLAVDAASAAQVAVRARDWRLLPFAAAALVVLQTAWSVGAWWSVLSSRSWPAAVTPQS